MGCILSSEESSCYTIFGGCRNARCLSSCSRCAEEHKEEIREGAIKIEQVVDAAMKKWVENHLRQALQKSLPAEVANAIEKGIIAAIDIDMVPRLLPPPALVVTLPASPEPTARAIISPPNIRSPTNLASPTYAVELEEIKSSQ